MARLAVAGLRLDFMGGVTLRALRERTGTHAAMHRRNLFGGLVASGIGAGLYSLERSRLLVRIVTQGAFCVVRIIARELLGDHLPHLVAAQALTRLRCERVVQ